MKILLFDDDKSTVDMLLSTVDWPSLGFTELITAYTVQQAREAILENGQPDVMICDIEAPGETGIDLLRWVRKQGYTTENIFLTNYDSFAFASEAMKLDCVEYILKMSPIQEVVEAVRRSLNRQKRNLRAEDESAAHISAESASAPPSGKADAEPPAEIPSEEWLVLLREGRKGELFAAIQAYLQGLAGLAGISASEMPETYIRPRLLGFSHDYLALLVRALEEHKISVNLIFNEPSAVYLFQNSLASVFNMLQWADYSLNMTIREIRNSLRASDTPLPTAAKEQPVPQVDQIKAYIDEHYTERISRTELAARFYISRDHLSHLFSARFGTTIPEYINKLRIEKAQEELAGGATVAEAAEQAGFENFSYFSTLFKKTVGLSPSEYQKSSRKVKDPHKK